MTSPEESRARRARRESRVRGMVLGLALGDAAVGGTQGTTTSQLAAFVAEGAIRAIVRHMFKGICHPPSVMWHGLQRWGHVQGLGFPLLGGKDRPDGWLAGVPALAQRRGSAPATVEALRAAGGSIPKGPTANPSRGHHALTRSVPLAALADGPLSDLTVTWAGVFASWSHGHPEVPDVVATGLMLLSGALAGSALDDAIAAAQDAPLGSEIADGVAQGAVNPLSARAALVAATAIAGQYPARDQIAEALRAAAAHPGAEGVAPMTGALLGALHGVEALPPDMWRLELGWVLDTLARDLVVQVDEPRCGGEWHDAADPWWWERYPGW